MEYVVPQRAAEHEARSKEVTDKQQPEALRSLYEITGNITDHNTVLVSLAELESLRTDYAAARLEIESLRGRGWVSCDYKSMFGAAVSTIATISEALGIDEEEAACANGAELILEAIQRKNEALLAALQR